MKILVTGASGFVGSRLCERLEQLGHQVYAQARNPEKLKFLNVPGIPVIGKLFHNQEHSWIEQLPQDLDAVVHVAGLVHSFDEENFFFVNAFATERMVQDLSQKYEHLKFLLISSLAAIGPSENLLLRKEAHRPHPVSDYGRSKLKGEELFFKSAPRQWKKIVVRPPIVFGPGDEGFLEVFQFVQKGFMPMIGSGAKKREYSFVCVYDLVEAIHKLLNHSFERNEIFFISYPETVTFEKIIETIAKKMKKRQPFFISLPSGLAKLAAHLLKKIRRYYPLDARLTPDKYHELTARAWTCSPEKSLTIPGIKYSWNLEETIEVTLQDYIKRGKL